MRTSRQKTGSRWSNQARLATVSRSLLCLMALVTACWAAPVMSAELRPVRFVLPNGLTVLFLEQHALPIVEAHTLVRIGSAQDPPDRAGLANLVSSLLDEGTTTHTSAQIAEQIEFVGGSIGARATEDYTSATVRILKKDVDLGLSLLAEILQRPSFPKHEFERVRSEVIGQVISEKDEPGTVAIKAFNQVVFTGHPYRWPVTGSEETLAKISHQDVLSFHSQHYLPNQAILSIVGDLSPDEAAALVSKYFGVWKRGTASSPKLPKPHSLERAAVKLIDKELTQSSIMIGHVGINRSNPDYYAVSVMNQILGSGGFGSRLMDNIRDKQGLAYGVMSLFDARLVPGPFYISLQTRTEATNQAIAGVLHELRAMREAPVSDQELADAKAYLMGSFALRLDTTSKLAQTLGLVEFHNLGLDYFSHYPQWIERVTKEDVLRVAKQYLDPQRVALIVVGDQGKAKVRLETKP
jgi:zinc protease